MQVFLLLRIACQATLWCSISHNWRNIKLEAKFYGEFGSILVIERFLCATLLYDWTCKGKFINLHRKSKIKMYPNIENKAKSSKDQNYHFFVLTLWYFVPILGFQLPVLNFVISEQLFLDGENTYYSTFTLKSPPRLGCERLFSSKGGRLKWGSDLSVKNHFFSENVGGST